MHIQADRLQLSPSDVTAFLACEHLTTLSLAHARRRSNGPSSTTSKAELIFRKRLEHEHAYLESLRADGKTIAEIEFDAGDWEADFLMKQPDGTYEALDTKLARSAKPA